MDTWREFGVEGGWGEEEVGEGRGGREGEVGVRQRGVNAADGACKRAAAEARMSYHLTHQRGEGKRVGRKEKEGLGGVEG